MPDDTMTDATNNPGDDDTRKPAAWCHALEAEYAALFGGPPLPPGTPDRLAAMHARLHAQAPSALCLSGGGIRSATFALGVLQGLAHVGALDSFDYLSTVSGGGYTGGWFTAWLRRAGAEGKPEVLRALDPARANLDELRSDTSPVERVRLTCRYLAPRGGIVSADVWTLVATMARNLMLNWMVLLPLIAAALLIPRIYYAVVRTVEVGAGPGAAVSTYPATSWLFIGAIALLATAVGYLVLNFTGRGAAWSQRRFLTACLAPMMGGAVALTLSWAEFPALVSLRAFVLWSAAVPALVWLAIGVVAPRIARRVPSDGGTLRVRVGPRTILAAAAAGPILGAGAYWFRVMHFGSGPLGESYSVAAVPVFLGLVLLQIALFVGFASNEQDDAVLEWWSRCAAWFAIAATLWLAAGLLVFSMADLIEAGRKFVAEQLSIAHDTSSAILGIAVPLLSSLVGFLTRMGGSAKGPSFARLAFQRIAVPATIVLLLGTMGWANLRALELIEYHRTPDGARCSAALAQYPTCHPAGAGLGEVFLLGIALAAAGLIMSRFVPVNRFSLHGMYRQRLIRTFLGASRRDRRPNAFTGFDANDDMCVHDLAPVRPLHVINSTLNAVRSTEVGRHEVAAQSFTFTPLHVGNRFVGFRNASEYGSDGGGKGTGLSLGMALAVSGAAASPAMGIFSTKSRAFLLTLANARLGLWFGNPSSEKTWQSSEPPLGVGPLSRELLGLTTDENPYVYLSDGGHYENLGLYEMVARRCRFIVVSDAGCDPAYTFDDLANAVRRIRLDLGIVIHFPPIEITRSGSGTSNAHGFTGTIKYSVVDGPDAPDGMILYLKATLSGDEPVDVTNFATTDALFPHDSTGDQFFDEARFESYRALGYHTVKSVVPDGMTFPTVAELCRAAAATLHPLAAAHQGLDRAVSANAVDVERA